MEILDKETKFAHLGKPGGVFSKGFARRLKKITNLVDLKDKKILDMGCGEGVWMNQFCAFTSPENVFGFDVDVQSLEIFWKSESEIPHKNVIQAESENLPYPDNSFDIVFSNEVFEHVEDDRKSVEEVVRVLKPGGQLIFFTPNRGWPFETHGMFKDGKYYWGNIFLLPWMPKKIYTRYAPHVRNYWNSDIKQLFKDLPIKFKHHSHVFSSFDKLEKKNKFLGKLLQGIFHTLEKTPLHWFGISHFVIIKKNK